jgi:hypothetical protein
VNGGGVFGALIFSIGALILFALLFSTFLVVPFFVFLGGIIAMMISDRNRGRGSDDGNGKGDDGGGDDGAPAREAQPEAVETTEIREVKS